MNSKSTLFALVLALLCVSAFGKAWDRLSVITVENESHFTHDDLGLTIEQPNGQFNFSVNPSPGSVDHQKRDQGWIASVWYFNTVTYYTATWNVPNTPANPSGQIVFFFNSFENSAYNDILQPVLQYNNGVAGWTLASWYGSGGQYYESTPYPVAPGDVIRGEINLSGSTWYIDGYVNGVRRTRLTASLAALGQQANAQFALEVYTITSCNQYPPNNVLNVRDITIRNGGTTLSPSWSPNLYASSCNPGASGTSNSARITWNSGSASSGGQATSGCGSGLLYCPGNGQCYSSNQYVCSGSYPYLCPSGAPFFCNGGCSSSSC